MIFFIHWFSDELDIKESFSQIVRVMKDDYYQLSLNDRKNYIILKESIPFELNDAIQFTSLTMTKRKKQLIKNMQSIVRIESHFDWLKVWYIKRARDNDYDLL